MAIRLKFGELLEARGVTANRLAQRQGLTRNTVYALANPRPQRNRVDLDVLADVMTALERESGQPVALTDVLELVADPIPSSAKDPLETLTQDKTPFDAKGFLENARNKKPVTPGLPHGARVPEGRWSIEDQLEEMRQDRDL